MSWGITCPPNDGAMMLLFQSKFVVSGNTPSRLQGQLAVTLTQDRTRIVVPGEVLYLSAVTRGMRTWTVLFDVQTLTILNDDTFTITLYHQNAMGVQTPLPNPRTLVTLTRHSGLLPPSGGGSARALHNIIYPTTTTTLSATAVSAYGMIAAGESVAADSGTLDFAGQVSDAGGTRPGGFWWVTFNAFAPPTMTQNTVLTVTLASGATGPQTQQFILGT